MGRKLVPERFQEAQGRFWREAARKAALAGDTFTATMGERYAAEHERIALTWKCFREGKRP